MKFIGHKFAFVVAVAFLALAGKGDDAVGVLRVDTDTNNIVARWQYDAWGNAVDFFNPLSDIQDVFDLVEEFMEDNVEEDKYSMCLQ